MGVIKTAMKTMLTAGAVGGVAGLAVGKAAITSKGIGGSFARMGLSGMGAAGGFGVGGAYQAFNSNNSGDDYLMDIFKGGVAGAAVGGLGTYGLTRAPGKIAEGIKDIKGRWPQIQIGLINKFKTTSSNLMSRADSLAAKTASVWNQAGKNASFSTRVKNLANAADVGMEGSSLYNASKWFAKNPIAALGGGAMALGAVSYMSNGPKQAGLSIPYNQQTIQASQQLGGMVSPSPGSGISTPGGNYMNSDFAQSANGLVQGLHAGRHS